MRWIQENGVSLTTKTTKTSHMQQDLDVFSFEFTASDKAQLDAATSPKGKPSFICSSLSATAGVPTHTLNNGIEMPMMSIGTWQYDVSTAEQVVKDAMSVGFTHIDTANNYNNQKGVGAALKGVARDSYFLTTKIPDGSASKTRSYLQQDLDDLGLDYVDLMLVHYPPRGNSCSAMQTQWAEMETFYKAGKAKAIGVSNFCPSSIECIMQKATVTPAVNQVQYHVGMGVDPIGVKSASEKYGIHLQAYSPLGNGESDLISGDLVTGIGSNYGKTGAQVAMRWIQENGVSLTTKTTKTSHMEQDLDVFSFQFTASDKAQLDAATSPSGKPSFMCTSLSATAGVPTHTLNNGIEMPMMSIGTWQYDVSTAEQVVKDAMSVGFTHIDTANNYNNQKGVGAALKGVARDSYFLTTKIPDGSASKTRSYLQQDLDDLGLDYVDLMLVHFPPRGNSCSAMQTQWAEMETFYKAGKAKAIGMGVDPIG